MTRACRRIFIGSWYSWGSSRRRFRKQKSKMVNTLFVEFFTLVFFDDDTDYTTTYYSWYQMMIISLRLILRRAIFSHISFIFFLLSSIKLHTRIHEYFRAKGWFLSRDCSWWCSKLLQNSWTTLDVDNLHMNEKCVFENDVSLVVVLMWVHFWCCNFGQIWDSGSLKRYLVKLDEQNPRKCY